MVGGVVTGGVTVNGSLIARASDPTQLGGTVEIGTSGQFDPTTGTYDAAYGYENITSANAGTITLGANALIDVSGGTRGGLWGGTVLLRAALLDDQKNVNVVLSSSATFRGARSVSLESFATWKHRRLPPPARNTSTASSIRQAGMTPAESCCPVVLRMRAANVVATWDGNALSTNAHDLNYYLANAYFKADCSQRQPPDLLRLSQRRRYGRYARHTDGFH